MLLKVYFPLFSNNLQSKKFSATGSNPGVGGTDFTSIRSAFLLANAKPEWMIVLVNTVQINIEESSSKVKQEFFENPSDFFESLIDDESFVVIAPALLLKRVNIGVLKKIESHIVCWSRHPFDIESSRLASTVGLQSVVCVGNYQFFSNKNIKSQIHFIQNIFISPKCDFSRNRKPPNIKQINIVHLGALVPGKGFSKIAKAWRHLKESFPGVKLHVIGSSATYGKNPEFDLIPTSKSYAQEILKFIPEEDIRNGEVIFYGNLGTEKIDIISKCDLAILNPTGWSEAFPASVLECMSCGLPVIASDDYGMSDAMRFFPELVIQGHKKIVDKVRFTVEDPLRYQELQQRSLSVAQWFESQNDLVITRWIRLIESISNKSIQDLSLLPTMPFYGNKLKLALRLMLPHPEAVRHYGRSLLKALRVRR